MTEKKVKKRETNCDRCGIKILKGKDIKRINGNILCKKCAIKKRLERRFERIQQLRDAGLINKRRTPEEIKLDRLKEKPKEKSIEKIIGIKNINKKKKKKKGIRLYLSRLEKNVLFRKYVGKGNTFEEANRQVTLRNNDMIELGKKLRIIIPDEVELGSKFKEEFARLCESI